MIEESNAKTRFVITGLGRCGSNLLKFALKQNRGIYMVGEYFNRNVYPEAFSEDGAYRAETFFANAPGQCAGFKIFEHQGRKDPALSVWDYLTSDPGIKVIHLKRRNYFERVLSLQVASARGQWLADHQGTDDIVVNMGPSKWERLLRQDAKKEQRLDRMFRDNDGYSLTYEDLVADWDGQTRAIQSFLGVKPAKLEQKLKKQETKHPSERCPNYQALKKHFAGTEFDWMFS